MRRATGVRQIGHSTTLFAHAEHACTQNARGKSPLRRQFPPCKITGFLHEQSERAHARGYANSRGEGERERVGRRRRNSTVRMGPRGNKCTPGVHIERPYLLGTGDRRGTPGTRVPVHRGHSQGAPESFGEGTSQGPVAPPLAAVGAAAGQRLLAGPHPGLPGEGGGGPVEACGLQFSCTGATGKDHRCTRKVEFGTGKRTACPSWPRA